MYDYNHKESHGAKYISSSFQLVYCSKLSYSIPIRGIGYSI